MNQTLQREWFVLVEGQVYVSIGKGHVKTDELLAIDKQFTDVLNASPYPLVHLIQDTRSLLSLPPLSEVRKVHYLFHPRMGYNVTLGVLQNPLIRFVLGMAVGIAGTRWKDVASYSEAYAYLLDRDPSLPPLSEWNFPVDGRLSDR